MTPPATSSVVSLHEAAELLGVHYMTAYRYVRLGLLPASKSGGVWQVDLATIDEFKAGGPLAPQRDRGSQRRAPWAERLEARLIAGDAPGAWGVIQAAMTSGVALDRVYGDILAPALTQIGERWSRDEIDVSVEHRASGIAIRIIGRLGPQFVGRGRTRGAVIVGSPAGERHSLPLAMLADLIRMQRWEVSDLGADVPVHSFVHAALATSDLAAVGVSVTVPSSLEAAAGVCTALRSVLPDLMVVLGGSAIRDEEHALALGASAFAADSVQFGELLDSWRASN
jgi:excisionase family DNA binding protein